MRGESADLHRRRGCRKIKFRRFSRREIPNMRFLAILASALFATASASRAAEPVDNDYFERKVRPILVANCVSCHGEKKQESGLRLDTRAGFAKGADAGPVVEPGKPEESPLIEAVNLLLAGTLPIGDIVAGLMTRPLKREES